MNKRNRSYLKKMSIISLLTVATFGIVMGIASSKHRFGVPYQAKKPISLQTNRRIYVIVEGWRDQAFISYHGGSPETSVAPENARPMTKVVSDYFDGIYYYDVPVSHTHLKIHEWVGSTKASDSSEEALIAHTYAGNNYKAIKVNPWVSDNEPRKIYYWDNIPCNSGQLAAILSHIESCESSYSSGYNAYPQLMDLFVNPSTFDGNTQVWDKEEPTTITNKLNMLQKMYNTEYSDSLDCCTFPGHTNSEMIDVTVLNNFHDDGRPYPTITRITPVVNGAPITASGLGNYLINNNSRTSTNYAIGMNGDVGLYVEEKNAAWGSIGSSREDDKRTVSTYLSSDTNGVLNSETYNKMVELFADILVRHCKDTLTWFNDTAAMEAHELNNLA